MALAPVALFCYNRPRHLRQIVEALLRNDLATSSDLYVFSDGPKNAADRAQIAEVHEYLGSLHGFKSVQIVKQPQNVGLAQSVINGVTEVCNKHGRVIVLEDDLVTSPYFLRYMNAALVLYENNPEVISIHGYIYPVKAKLPATFFIRGADCWGWATWKRGWDLFNPDGQFLLAELEKRQLTRDFDFNNSFGYTQMLRDQIAGKNNSWAIRWYAAAFLQDKLTLYPGTSLVKNIGNDASGTHCENTTHYDAELITHPVDLERLPLMENRPARLVLAHHLRRQVSPPRSGIVRRLWRNFLPE